MRAPCSVDQFQAHQALLAPAPSMAEWRGCGRLETGPGGCCNESWVDVNESVEHFGLSFSREPQLEVTIEAFDLRTCSKGPSVTPPSRHLKQRGGFFVRMRVRRDLVIVQLLILKLRFFVMGLYRPARKVLRWSHDTLSLEL
ncbi:hypothetical protein PanWU01x14_037370 [Parasponia andersonii]|uniref:Uncharacterized protein n=1 Tax=Parasponia andersonii TaxID=3476 RepID=A0A2P5DSR9_PARAD|nr:hypothetical protein PanWU01x14_037370 [Parasponia andersonii]